MLVERCDLAILKTIIIIIIIIANLGFKFRSHFTAHCGCHADGGRRAARRAACGRIISRHASQC